MMLWFAAAAMVAITLFVLLRALAAPSRVIEHDEQDVAFYRAQSAEIARQRAAGMIDEYEAKAAEAEGARRLLVRNRERQQGPVADGKRGNLARIAVAIAVPALALPIYLGLGAPNLPAQPFAARTDIDGAAREMDRLLARLEAHLSENPDDAKALELAFPVYMRLGRYDNAVASAERLLALKGETAGLLSALAEAQIFANGGQVPAVAAKTLDRSLELDPKLARSVFYRSIAYEQAGLSDKALALLRPLADTLPDGPEKRAVDAQIARLTPHGPQGGAAETIRNMPQGEREQAIRGMVASLEARLAADGGAPDEWLRLVRSLMVVGEKGRAAAALKAGLAQHGKDDAAAQALKALAAELSVPTEAHP